MLLDRSKLPAAKLNDTMKRVVGVILRAVFLIAKPELLKAEKPDLFGAIEGEGHTVCTMLPVRAK